MPGRVEIELKAFVPGLELSRGFFSEIVEPLLASGFPALRYSAALIGAGSEVLGFDTEMSADHHWGPRVMLFLPEGEVERAGAQIRTHLARRLPTSYRGYSTNFSDPDPADRGVQRLTPAAGATVNHRVELFTLQGYFLSYLGLPTPESWSTAEWLSVPFQKLRSIAAGELFRDDLSLAGVRARLAWYPRDLWLYLLGSCWARIGEEEHLMGRAGSVGDELGSAIIASRLARDVMRIAFLLERQYPPYAKWLGTAFARLSSAPLLLPLLEAARRSGEWRERGKALAAAFEELVLLQRERGIATEAAAEAGDFWGRPFQVIHGERIAGAVFSGIAEEGIAALARERPIGNIDLVSDNTGTLTDPRTSALLRPLFEPPVRRAW